MSLTTIVPDTNIWRYIVDADATERVRMAAKRAKVSLVACPAVVYECLRIQDPTVRRRLAKALTQNDWHRPMPEAYLEAEAVRAEIERLHPEWLIRQPDLRHFRENRDDWRSGFWRRVRSDPKSMGRFVTELQSESIDAARLQSKTARKQALQLGQTEESLRLATAEAWFIHPVPGWDGQPFDAWRGQSQAHWWDAVVRGKNQTAMDWLGPWLDVPHVRTQPDVWMTMWTREVKADHLPREWIRWAMSEAQALRKVTSGTPVDNQIATYLADFDIFITSDRAFAHSIEQLRQHSPSPLARVSTAPAGPAAVTHLLALFDELADATADGGMADAR